MLSQHDVALSKDDAARVTQGDNFWAVLVYAFSSTRSLNFTQSSALSTISRPLLELLPTLTPALQLC
jgi:hypothetical protein